MERTERLWCRGSVPYSTDQHSTTCFWISSALWVFKKNDQWVIARRYMSLEVIVASCAALEGHQQPHEERLAIPA